MKEGWQAYGIILYLLHYNSFEVLDFFDPEAVIEKEDCFWDEDKLTLINLLFKCMNALETADCDYTFVDVGQEGGDEY